MVDTEVVAEATEVAVEATEAEAGDTVAHTHAHTHTHARAHTHTNHVYYSPDPTSCVSLTSRPHRVLLSVAGGGRDDRGGGGGYRGTS